MSSGGPALILCFSSCFVFYSLADLDEFIQTTEKGLSRKVEKGDSGGLVEVMGHLLAVKERHSATDAMFEPLKETIELLKAYEQQLPEEVHQQLEVGEGWWWTQQLAQEQKEREQEWRSTPGVFKALLPGIRGSQWAVFCYCRICLNSSKCWSYIEIFLLKQRLSLLLCVKNMELPAPTPSDYS